jgi:homoserine O-succinyltransferase
VGSRARVASTLLSCLSAHAALTIFDGIARMRFRRNARASSPDVEAIDQLTEGLEPEILLPHSRWNTVPREALERAGYDVVITPRRHGLERGLAREGGRRNWCSFRVIPNTTPRVCFASIAATRGATCTTNATILPFLPYHCVSTEDWGALETHAPRDHRRRPRSGLSTSTL